MNYFKISKCYTLTVLYNTMCFIQVEGVEAQDEDGGDSPASGGWRETGAARARLDAGGTHAGLLGGSPLTLLQGIIPGTYHSYI